MAGRRLNYLRFHETDVPYHDGTIGWCATGMEKLRPRRLALQNRPSEPRKLFLRPQPIVFRQRSSSSAAVRSMTSTAIRRLSVAVALCVSAAALASGKDVYGRSLTQALLGPQLPIPAPLPAAPQTGKSAPR